MTFPSWEMLSPSSKSPGFVRRTREKRIGFSGAAAVGRRTSDTTNASVITAAMAVGIQKRRRALGDTAARAPLVPVVNAGLRERVGERFRALEPIGREFLERLRQRRRDVRRHRSCARVVTGAAGSVMIFMMICCAEPPMCGGSPASISYSTDASE